MSSQDKTTAWTPLETGDPAREHHLAHAYLLCQRREFDEAERLLKMLLRSNPHDRDAHYLLGRIQSTERAEKYEDEKLRSWRFRLGLQSTWARFCAYVGASVVGGYGVWNIIRACAIGIDRGFSSEITTMLRRGGRYEATHFVPWTRPIYYDVLYGAALATIALFIILIVYRVSRGAEMWEEIGDPGTT